LWRAAPSSVSPTTFLLYNNSRYEKPGRYDFLFPVKQQNLLITIKYPEMVAEIVPHFRKEELPAFGKTNLWFL